MWFFEACVSFYIFCKKIMPNKKCFISRETVFLSLFSAEVWKEHRECDHFWAFLFAHRAQCEPEQRLGSVCFRLALHSPTVRRQEGALPPNRCQRELEMTQTVAQISSWSLGGGRTRKHSSHLQQIEASQSGPLFSLQNKSAIPSLLSAKRTNPGEAILR